MAFCIFWGTITGPTKRPSAWSGWNAISWPRWAFPIRMPAAMLETGAMSDSQPRMTADTDPGRTGQRDFPGLARRSGSAVRENPESWFNRLLRAVFGWSPTSIRSDLQVLLEGEGAETGFSPEESRMLKNILSLRERRVDDVMVPRADIIAVQQDVPLGDLLKVFKDAAHS